MMLDNNGCRKGRSYYTIICIPNGGTVEPRLSDTSRSGGNKGVRIMEVLLYQNYYQSSSHCYQIVDNCSLR